MKYFRWRSIWRKFQITCAPTGRNKMLWTECTSKRNGTGESRLHKYTLLFFVARFFRWIGEKLASDSIGAHFLASFMTFHINNVQFFTQKSSIVVKQRMAEHWTTNRICQIWETELWPALVSRRRADVNQKYFHCLPGTLCLQVCRLKPETALFFIMRVLGSPLSDVLRRQRFLTQRKWK